AGCFAFASYIANEVTKPTISYCNELTCSAAYAIASACDYVYASANASVGSIGVVMNLFNVTENLKQQGVTVHTIQGGANKTIGSPFHPLSDSDLEYLQGVVNAMYDEFCSLVATNRGLSVQSIRNTEASVYTSQNAKSAGLIDGIRTLTELREELGIQTATKPDAVIVTAENENKLSGYSDVLALLKANQNKYIIKV
ncbi:TPA: S49 family peptidase, partial [Escherichia coli]|nr:S49 family peptidase [Escherichia coli]